MQLQLEKKLITAKVQLTRFVAVKKESALVFSSIRHVPLIFNLRARYEHPHNTDILACPLSVRINGVPLHSLLQ